MRLFVSNRNTVVRSSAIGQSVGFKKGVPTYVPPRMEREVMEKGILPVDEKGAAIDPANNDVGMTQEPVVYLAPDDGYDREVKILEVFRAIVKRNDASDFTAAGMPSAKAVTAALRWSVDTKECRVVWTKHRRELLNGPDEE